MPSFEGNYSYLLHADFTDHTISGSFTVDPPEPQTHGPVHVKDTYHFEYADGTPYVSIGTTAYVWHLQDEKTKEQTLDTLKDSAFNKLRFCIFPKHYVYNLKDPSCFPYQGKPMDSSVLNEDNFMNYTGKAEGNHFDKKRFNPVYFQNIENKIQKLGDLGIEADLILFHPYDRWGFSSMPREEDELYLKYVIARFACYRNVWWAMANEWDLFADKTIDDFEYNATILVKNDPYNHLRSIHNCRKVYDHHKEWITHVSYQRIDLYKTVEVTGALREEYLNRLFWMKSDMKATFSLAGEILPGKKYEDSGKRLFVEDIPDMGETYLNEQNILWWAHGGTLHGESHLRFPLLKKIMEEVPGNEIAPLDNEWDSTCAISEEDRDVAVKRQYIFYYGFQRPGYRDFFIDDSTDYDVDVIDTWNMTVQSAGVHHGRFRITLPSRQYMAVRLRIAEDSDFSRVIEAETSSED